MSVGRGKLLSSDMRLEHRLSGIPIPTRVVGRAVRVDLGPEPPHGAKGQNHIVERAAASHRVHLADQRLKLARSADFVELEQCSVAR